MDDNPGLDSLLYHDIQGRALGEKTMGFRIGRILIWWVVLFLVTYAFYLMPYGAFLIERQGIAFEQAIYQVMTFGIIVIGLLDAALSD